MVRRRRYRFPQWGTDQYQHERRCFSIRVCALRAPVFNIVKLYPKYFIFGRSYHERMASL
jgi:hypothetical protein